MNVKQIKISQLRTFAEYPGVRGDLTDIFEDLPYEKFIELKSSISDKGLTQPILTWQGYVIDGHHRLRAAKDLGWSEIPAVEADYAIDRAEEAFVENNYARRQLSPKEKARAAKMLREMIAERIRNEEKKNAAMSSDGDYGGDEEEWEVSVGAEPVEQGAEALGVSRRQFRDLAAAGAAPPEIVDKIGDGVTVKEAARIGRAYQDPDKKKKIDAVLEDYKKEWIKLERNAGKKVGASKEAHGALLDVIERAHDTEHHNSEARCFCDDLWGEQVSISSDGVDVRLDPTSQNIKISDHINGARRSIGVITLGPYLRRDSLDSQRRLFAGLQLAAEAIIKSTTMKKEEKNEEA